jgi:hypothetical protein
VNGLQKPQTWEAAAKLVGSPDLERLLTVRLIELAFTAEGATAIRAIEQLRAGGAGDPVPELADISTDQLLRLREGIVQRIREVAGHGGDDVSEQHNYTK